MRIHMEQAFELLRALPFAAEEMEQLHAAAMELPWETLEPLVEGLQRPLEAEKAKNDLYALIGDIDQRHHGLAGMCVFAAAMYGTAKRLNALGISREVLLHTCSCLRLMSEKYRDQFGVFGFDRGFWVWRQSSGIIFRLGSLEYEYLPALSRQAAEWTGLRAGEPALSIHIPTGTDLSRKALDDSYAQAHAFYREHPEVCFAGKQPQGIVCHTWLLSPALRTFLGENSGIRRFAEDFRLCHADENGDGYKYFLYLAGKDVPLEDLPERTSLQRAVKKHVLTGGKIGEGFGVLEK